ncbi:hypothetical protein E2C01_059626 [Portunus trituberculatus]|uniref:Uncharacterized protein n=1 Tax=Portunus trituberculatus TaxID=210409 RepID=A0A5B7GYW8_PORTR|nr:hypothetical protein [Portunus trituberculatus]
MSKQILQQLLHYREESPSTFSLAMRSNAFKTSAILLLADSKAYGGEKIDGRSLHYFNSHTSF